MRILQVADFYPPSPGGLEAHVARVSKHLAKRGHEVIVAAGQDPTQDQASPTEDEGSVAVHRLGTTPQCLPPANGRALHPPWPDPIFARRLLDLAKHYRPTVLHAHGWSEFSAAWVARRLDIPLIVTLHDYGLCCPTKSLYCAGRPCRVSTGVRRLDCAQLRPNFSRRVAVAAAIRLGRQQLAKRVQRFAAVSNYVAQQHLAVGVGDLDTMRVVPNFVDRPRGDPAPAPVGAPILYAGPARPYKGRQVLEDAYQALPTSTRPDLWLAGEASSRRNETAPNSSSRGVRDLGRQSSHQMTEAFRTSAVTVVPSLWPDPCPTVALEAMAAGRPVIASSVGGLTDIVEADVTGLLVAPGDAQGLAAALTQLLNNPPLAQRLGTAGRSRVTLRYSATAVIPRIEQLYSEVA